MDLKSRRHKFEHKLNDIDDQIIDYVLNNKEEVSRNSIQTLAKEHYTVPNTITRLSKKLGYDGFSHMKNSLKEEVKESEEEQTYGAMYNLKKTFEVIDYEMMRTISEVVRNSNKSFVFGVGDNQPFCEILSRNIKIGGKQTEFFLHRHDAVYALNHAGSHDVLILMSMSGETKQILEMAELAKEKGVTTISLTHFSKNRLQEQVDYRFFFYSPRRMSENYNISDKTPVMLAIQSLSEVIWETV